MQNELRFRAWHTKKKIMLWSNWVSGEDLRFCTSQDVEPGMLELPFCHRDLIVMRWVGMTDQDNVGIYESDIVSGDHPHYRGKCIGVVQYGALAFSYVGTRSDGLYWFNTITNPSFKQDLSVTVIGNIYETPDLLKCTR